MGRKKTKKITDLKVGDVVISTQYEKHYEWRKIHDKATTILSIERCETLSNLRHCDVYTVKFGPFIGCEKWQTIETYADTYNNFKTA